MPHRKHLFSLRIGNALRESCVSESYTRGRFLRDLMAGVTVGIVAIPLSMALAIATGVPPQYGLYTAIVAGFVIALTGGSRFSVSGPTAAFIVILHPVALNFGLAGLLMASILAGLILVLMALLRLGRYIEYIPESVTLGFTAGIAIVIVSLQIKDFLGLPVVEMPESFVAKMQVLGQALPAMHVADALVGALTLLVMVLWSRLQQRLHLRVTGHLPALLLGVGVALLLARFGHEVDTIGSRFSYLLPDGSAGRGIPPMLPTFEWPWLQPGPNGEPLRWNFANVRALVSAALAIAMLGAIESLLCAVVLDGLTGKRHSANSELLGQGIGNLVAPFWGGFTATAALARSATNVKAGAESPVAAIIHSLVVLLGLVLLAPLLAYLPMASMAALLLLVAWNMSEAHKVVKLLRRAPMGDVLVLLICLSLTVLFDMVIAIGVGIVLAALMFMRDLAGMIRVTDITDNRRWLPTPLPPEWCVVKISGPLFFAAADRVFGELSLLARQRKGLIVVMEAVPLLDAGGLASMEKLIDQCSHLDVQLIFAELQFQPLKTLSRAGLQPVAGKLAFTATLEAAVALVTEPRWPENAA